MNRRNTLLTLLFIWAFVVAKTVKATTIGQFIGPYEEELLVWATITAFLGGAVRTILSLESDKRPVMEIFKQALWDSLKSLISGLSAFFLVQALRSSGWTVSAEVRFASIMVAGWQRLSAFIWMKEIIYQFFSILKTKVSKNDNP